MNLHLDHTLLGRSLDVKDNIGKADNFSIDVREPMISFPFVA